MRFTTFITPGGQQSWGALGPNGKILDLGQHASSLLEFLRDPQQAAKLEKIRAALPGADIAVDSVRQLACIPNPPSMRDGYAFRQHVEAARRNRGVPMIEEFDNFPVFYFTNHYGVIGPGACEVRELHLDKLDFELEAAIVIGRTGKNISAARADDYIFGYTIMNDFSARGLQMEEMKLSLGPAKGKDFATALGPWLVTRDELSEHRKTGDKGERYVLDMSAELNGKEVSRGNLKDMNWSFAQIVERASYGVELRPGDVIGSGTVGTGCFMELNGTHKTNQWLKPGDRITLRIQGLGELTNEIVSVEPASERA